MNFNYFELLAFDRVTSIVKTNGRAGRKLIAWADRLTSTDYPTSWQLDMLDGTVRTLSTSDGLTWTDTTYDLTIAYNGSGVPTSFKLALTATPSTYIYSGATVVEGLLTLTDGTKVSLVETSTRSGIDEVRVTFGDLSRASITDEMDKYILANMNRLNNQEIKGHALDGVWRLAVISKDDSGSPDMTGLSLIYKRGYAQSLGSGVVFPEGLVLNKEDFKTDSTKLVIRFPNLDQRYVETAKAPFLAVDTITNPVFGGVVFDGHWNNIKMVTTETGQGGEPDDAASVIWYLTQHNNTDLYFRYVARPGVINGHYFKWEATSDTLDSMISSTYFDSTGTIDTDADPSAKNPRTSWNLREEVDGRIVIYRKTTRDEEDRLFDVEIQITWIYPGDEAVISSKIGTRTVLVNISLQSKTQTQIESYMESVVFTSDGTRLFI